MPALGGRPAVVQPNYGLLAISASIHRGACQRMISDLLQRLGVHILSGRAVKVCALGGMVVLKKSIHYVVLHISHILSI